VIIPLCCSDRGSSGCPVQVVLSIGRIFAGDGWRYLWEQVAAGAEDYYLAGMAAGESPGRWGGNAAGPELGLAGEVTEEQMHRLFGLLSHPATEAGLGNPARKYRDVTERLAAARQVHDTVEGDRWVARRLGLTDVGAGAARIETEEAAFRADAAERWTETEARIRRAGQRQAVTGFDLTFSPPKSVSVLWAAAPPAGRDTIWRAHREGVAAAMTFVEREAAWSRVGYNGVRHVDTSGLVTASFDHRMSRTGDVQIHTHTAVLNRVRCDDGEWRSLDGRAVYRVAAAAGALYDRVREAALERDLNVGHEIRRPGGPREIVGVDDDVCRLFSSRRVQIEGRLADLVTAWRHTHEADPSRWVLSRLSQWAALDTRTRKDGSESTETALARWAAQTRTDLGVTLPRVREQATTPPSQRPLGKQASRSTMTA
jgi:conjugative relaxase-like TrwC/TraI family protein